MAVTYEPIASVTLGSNAADITFSNIPAFTDLILVTQGRSTQAGTSYDTFLAQVNGDTASNYSNTFLYGDGSAAASGRQTSQTRLYLGELPQASSASITPGITRTHFLSYANTNVFKTALSEDAAHVYAQRLVNLWRSTSAITSIKIYAGNGNLSSGFTAALYGIKAA